MSLIMIVMMTAFIALVFYLANLVVMQLEQRADEDALLAKDTFTKIFLQKDKAHQEKSNLEKQAAQIFTLYEMTKEISAHVDEQQAFDIFRRKLREHIPVDDIYLYHDQGEATLERPGYLSFELKSKEKRLGVLVYKGVAKEDEDKLAILAHQFALALRRIRLYKDIETLAITDGLTGVYTRRYFLERYEEEIRRCALRKTPLSFVMIDADHFKRINDQFGHLTGDVVLKEIGSIIKDNVREIDIVGRYGGEEFCVVLPDTDLEGSKVVAERIRRSAFKRQIKAYDNTIQITLSAGIAMYPQDGTLSEEIIDKADWALYRAKAQGRNMVIAFGNYKS